MFQAEIGNKQAHIGRVMTFIRLAYETGKGNTAHHLENYNMCTLTNSKTGALLPIDATHNKVGNIEAVKFLTEARLDPRICKARTYYLEAQVKSYISYLDEQGKDGKAVVLSQHEYHMRLLEEDVMGEFIWTTSRETNDEGIMGNIGGDNNACLVELVREDLDGKIIHHDDQRKALDYGVVRMEDEDKCASDYWGLTHRIAYQGFMKTINDITPWSRKVGRDMLAILDKVEQRFDPMTKKGLSIADYRMLNRFITKVDEKGKETRELDPKCFRARLNNYRFGLFVLTNEQWSYLTNYLNVLTSWKCDEDGGAKQHPCLAQGIMVEDKWVNPEEVKYEVVSTFYTRD